MLDASIQNGSLSKRVHRLDNGIDLTQNSDVVCNTAMHVLDCRRDSRVAINVTKPTFVAVIVRSTLRLIRLTRLS